VPSSEKLKVWIKGCNPQSAPTTPCCPPHSFFACILAPLFSWHWVCTGYCDEL